MLQKLTENIWVAAAPQRFLGLQIGTRMTIVSYKEGKLLLHSPVPLTQELRQGLSALGEVGAIVAPNRYHHLHVKDYIEEYPQALVYAAPGLPEKRKDLRFHDVLSDESPEAWEGRLAQTVVRGMPALNEVVFFHPVSRTLMLTDLCFNYPPSQSFWQRLYRRWIQDYEAKFAVARIIKLMVRDRGALRFSCDRILQWDFDRVTVTHGEILESGGKEAFRNAFRWL
jgi:hypothetical protein